MTKIKQEQALDELVRAAQAGGMNSHKAFALRESALTQQAPAPMPSRQELGELIWKSSSYATMKAPLRIADAVLDLIRKTQERG